MTLSWTVQFLYSQFLVRFPHPAQDFSGQTVIVTGSNVGLGREAARHISSLGADKVILAVRTVSKGEAAADDIAKACNVPRSRLEVWQLDMGSTDSIKDFAERAKTLKRLDAAVLNAGVLSNQWTEHSGIESHLAVNVIGTILLANLLLPTLESSARLTGRHGRLAIVGSDLMYLADRKQVDTAGSIIEALEDRSSAPQMGDRYALSKLLVFYSVHELARQQPVAKTSLIISVITPGACQSDLVRDGKSLAMSMAWATIARTTEVGARTLVFGIDPELSVEFHGKFVMDNRVNDARQVLDDELDQRLAKKWNAELGDYLKKVMSKRSDDSTVFVQ